jgi:hypothetical protein
MPKHDDGGAAPIDHKDLPGYGEDAIKCWTFNQYRARGSTIVEKPVYPLWVRKGVSYTLDPKESRTGGSRSVPVVYETESDAWEALFVAVDEWWAERRATLKTLAARAQAGEVSDG